MMAPNPECEGEYVVDVTQRFDHRTPSWDGMHPVGSAPCIIMSVLIRLIDFSISSSGKIYFVNMTTRFVTPTWIRTCISQIAML